MTSTTSTILPDHILGAVLALAERQFTKENPGSKRLAFRSHDFELQGIFHDLRENEEYPILSPFVFSDRGPDPYSPALGESVSRLQLSGLIGRENPDYEVVFVCPAAQRFFDKSLKAEFSGPELEQLGKVASEFIRRVRTA